jgi:hypothetical protein
MKLPFASRTGEKALPLSPPAPFTGRLSWAMLDSKLATAVILGVILLVGLQLRVSHVNWDKGQHLHPDERFLSIIESQIRGPDSVGQYFDSRESQLNPYNHSDTFVYGTVPLFLNKAVSEWLDRDADGSTHWTADVFRDLVRPFGVDMEYEDGGFTFNGGYDSNQVGRVLSALADVLTIALVFELGRVLYGRRAGLLAAGLLSLTVLHIQYSHFFGSETFLALFVTAVIYFAVRILKYESPWNFVLAGLFYGLALATKLSAAPVLAMPALAVLIRLWPHLMAQWDAWGRPRSVSEPPSWRPVLTYLGWSVALVLIAGLAFCIGQPYAFDSTGFFDVIEVKLDVPGDLLSTKVVDPRSYLKISDKFNHDIEVLQSLQKGSDFPPNLQWIGRPFLFFPLKNIALWGMGLPLALAAFASLVYGAKRALLDNDKGSLLLVLWSVGYFLFAGRGFVPTMRYFIPIYPSLVVLAAFGILHAWHFAASGRAAESLPRSLAKLRPWARPALQGAVALRSWARWRGRWPSRAFTARTSRASRPATGSPRTCRPVPSSAFRSGTMPSRSTSSASIPPSTSTSRSSPTCRTRRRRCATSLKASTRSITSSKPATGCTTRSRATPPATRARCSITVTCSTALSASRRWPSSPTTPASSASTSRIRVPKRHSACTTTRK